MIKLTGKFMNGPIAGLLLVIASAPAYAYIDPGTGSLLLQGLIAAVAGAMIALRVYWGKLKLLFNRKHAVSDQPAGDGEPDVESRGTDAASVESPRERHGE
jgi:hypothetical protein